MAGMKKNQNNRTLAFRRLSQYFAARSGDADDKRTLAEAMEGEPVITPALKEIGLPTVLTALRAYDDEDAKKFLEVYDSRTKIDQQKLKWEEVAVASGVGVSRLFEVCCSAVRVYGLSVSQMVLSNALPAIVKRSIKSAQTAKGLDDRMAMLKAGAILPVPKGSQIALQINASQPQEAAQELTVWDQERQLRELHDAWDVKKRLPAARPPELPAQVSQIQDAAIEALEDIS